VDDTFYRPRPAGSDAPAPVVLGCMNFGKRTPEREARAIVDLALERGVGLYDTANAYGDGESERILGRCLAGRRDRVHVATKVGWWKKEGLGPERVRQAIGESLERLGMDHVDLYYLHVPDHDTPIEATLEAVGELLASGRVRRFGTSNYASWQLLELLVACDRLGLPRPTMSQQLYNLLIRQLDLEYLRFARRYGQHTSVYNPLAGGLLARPAPALDTSAPKGSRFDKNGLYQRRYLSDAFAAAARAFAEVAREAGLDLLTLAYAWLARQPGVDSILVGPASVAHLEAALTAVATPLSADTRAAVDAVHRDLVGTDASYAR